MSWSLGTLTNNYTQSVAIEIFAAVGSSRDYSQATIQGGNINVVIPLRGTIAFVDRGPVPGSPPNALDVYFLDQTWNFRYAQTTKLNVTIDASGKPTIQQA
jgi:hypothetical protein